MARGANKKLESYSAQRRALDALRKTGRIDMACAAAGVSLATFIRFREFDHIFDNAVLNAIEYWRFQQDLDYNANVRKKGFKLLEERIDNGTITDPALLKFLYDRDGRIGK
jgi:hypothetical protein